MNARDGEDKNHISFSRIEKTGSYTDEGNLLLYKANDDDDLSPQTLFLLSKSCILHFFDFIPKHFTIHTKNFSCNFNTEFLKDTSSVISDHLKENPNNLQYNLNIYDEKNVLAKFEALYNGEIAFFDEDEIIFSQKITNLLQIKNCPNYLKPENLRNGKMYYSYNFIEILSSGVQLNQQSLINFLQNNNLESFLIITKRKEYKCNILGIHSSKIIHEILEKDTTISQYIYDFDDEFDEFQSICDIFNFQKVNINKDNMNILKKIAEDLEINSIMYQIDNYIDNYDEFTQKVEEHEKIIDSIDQLFSWLNNIKELTVENVKNFIIQSEWIENFENIQELAAFILQIVKVDFRLHHEMIDLLIQLKEEANESNNLAMLIPYTVQMLMQFFMPPQKMEIILHYSKWSHEHDVINKLSINFSNEEENKYVFLFIRTLYKRGIIPKEEIIKKLQNYDFKNHNLHTFFLPEIAELYPNKNLLFKKEYSYPNYSIDCFNKLIEEYLPDKLEIYTRMLDNIEPNDSIANSLRNDDVDTFQSIIIRYQIDISKANVNYNIFDDFGQTLSLIDYAALYGSLKCFKYLLLNNAQVDTKTLYFAVYGGNIEIIKIVDQRCEPNDEDPQNHKHIKNDLGDDDSIIKIAIAKHKNDLFDWIFEQRFIAKGKIGNYLNDIALFSAKNGNAHSLIEIIDKGFDISSESFKCIIEEASKNGFYKLCLLLMKLIEKKEKENLIVVGSYDFKFNGSVQLGNLYIFKLFVKKMNQENLEKAILFALKMNYDKIIYYYFNQLVNDGYYFIEKFVELIINISLSKKTDDYFKFLISKFQETYPQIFTLKLLSKMFVDSCSYGKLIPSKIIIELILHEDQKFDFSIAFSYASYSNSLSICKYIFEKKLYIDYDKLSIQASKLGFIDEELFSVILSNANQNQKEKFKHCIYNAIEKKNINLVKFLLNEKGSYKDALLKAASINDIEMVNLLLNYDTEPSFINRHNEKGTALHISIANNNLEIVKRLLSIPGINPNLCNKDNDLPITLAIKKTNIEIVDAILNFYGDNIQSNIWILNQIMASFSKFTSDDFASNEKVWEIIKHVFRIKGIDPNYRNENTIFYEACYYNKIEMVEFFFEIDKIDVNKYSVKNGNTPLMAALTNNNIEIAKILLMNPKTDINFRNLNTETALTIATKQKQNEIIDLLIHDERFDPYKSCLDYAFYLSDNETAKKFMKLNELDVNYKYIYKTCAKKNFFSSYHYFEPIKTETSLIQSININNIEKIDLIINHSSFDKEKSRINEALRIAIKNKNNMILKKLMKLIENEINKPFKENILLKYAANSYYTEFVKLILNNPNFNPSGNQIVYFFVKLYNQINENSSDENHVIETMNLILDYDRKHSKSINFQKLLENGQSFFTVIFSKFNFIDKISDFLLDKGVDPNRPDKFNEFPLENAIKLESLNFVHSLLNSNKINLQQKIKDGTYLHFAAKQSDSSIFKLLLDKNEIDINSIDDYGKTPLFNACKYKNIDCVNMLFEKDDLDYLHQDNNGKDALKTIKKLSKSEYNCAIKSKETYHNKIISILKEENKSNSRNYDESENKLYEEDIYDYDEEESYCESSNESNGEDESDDLDDKLFFWTFSFLDFESKF